MQNYEIGQTVHYDYDKYRTRTGEVVEYDAAANRYRVYWHTETTKKNPNWQGQPNKRTWVRPEALRPAYQVGGDILEKAANGTSGLTLDEIAADNM